MTATDQTLAPSARATSRSKGVETVAFTRLELNRILNVYGQFVAAGDWRDYAIDHHRDAAIFSIFRRTSEAPLYRIEKRPALARKQGAWVVVTMTGAILKRGHDLAQVLRVFDRQRLRLAD
ncbi:MAG: DUF2794 domain-containing protein [Alphaproteobacteria bacterium]|nr:DUF2794 domain-containing protein [Alphaproteobacteria bacterium]